MYTDLFGRKWTGPFPFSLGSVTTQARLTVPGAGSVAFSKVPLHPNIAKWGPFAGVYMILQHKQPVYIGIASDSVFTRLQKHASGTGNKPAGPVAGNPAYEFVYWLCDGQSAKQIESNVLVKQKPIFNQRREYVNYIENITMH